LSGVGVRARAFDVQCGREVGHEDRSQTHCSHQRLELITCDRYRDSVGPTRVRTTLTTFKWYGLVIDGILGPILHQYLRRTARELRRIDHRRYVRLHEGDDVRAGGILPA